MFAVPLLAQNLCMAWLGEQNIGWPVINIQPIRAGNCIVGATFAA
jgi:hypothetical protein